MALRINIIAIGLIKGAEKELYENYAGRISWPLRTIEIDDRKLGTGGARQAAASARLLQAVPESARVIALDEQGRAFDSRAFARQIQTYELDGDRDVAFLIGGADGHTDAVTQKADLVLSFGKQTWPHMLARVMLAEQLYRAGTILSGHPYHRD